MKDKKNAYKKNSQKFYVETLNREGSGHSMEKFEI